MPAENTIDEERLPTVLPHLAESRRWTIPDLFVFGVWILVVGSTLLRHEKWADEAQAWLLARDLNLSTLWGSELRYEGSPGLWHTLLWLAQHLFHLPYASLGVIGACGAALGAAVLLCYAPFPRPLRWLMIFSYFLVYQYAVIARPYVLLPLLAFAAAHLFRNTEHPEWIAAVLALLACDSIHGILMAGCIGLAYAWQALAGWRHFEKTVRLRYLASAAGLLLVLGFLVWVLLPPADVEAMHDVHQRTLSILGGRMWEGLNGAFFDFAPLTVLWLGVLGVWSLTRRGVGAWLLPLLIVALAGFYGCYGWVHHQGTIFVAAITGLWIAWPTPEERENFSLPERQVHVALVAGLTILLGYQAFNAVAVIRNEYRYPYSGAGDAARYLKSVGADQRPIMGYLYGMVAVEAYFDHNIQANSPTTYFHHGTSLARVQFDGNELDRLAPEYVVIPDWFNVEGDFQQQIDPAMRAHGYTLAHFSDGYMLSKRGWEMRQVYFIYRRNYAVPSAY